MERINISAIQNQILPKKSIFEILQIIKDKKISCFHLDKDKKKTKLTTKKINEIITMEIDNINLLNSFHLDLGDELSEFPTKLIFIDKKNKDKLASTIENRKKTHWSVKKDKLNIVIISALLDVVEKIANSEDHSLFLKSENGKKDLNAQALAKHIDDHCYKYWGEDKNGKPKRGFSQENIAKNISEIRNATDFKSLFEE